MYSDRFFKAMGLYPPDSDPNSNMKTKESVKRVLFPPDVVNSDKKVHDWLTSNRLEEPENKKLSKEVEEMKAVLMKLSEKISSSNVQPKNSQCPTVRDTSKENNEIMKISREVQDMRAIVNKLMEKVESNTSRDIHHDEEVKFLEEVPVTIECFGVNHSTLSEGITYSIPQSSMRENNQNSEPFYYIATPIQSDENTEIISYDSVIPPSIDSSESETHNETFLMNSTVDSSTFASSSSPVIQDTSSSVKNDFKRKRDRRNCCPYCKKLVTNFVRHITSIHKCEEDVKRLISITDSDKKKQKIKRTEISSKLRNKGNYEYNLKVVNNKMHDQLLPRKRPDKNKYQVDNVSHVVCKFCLGLFKREFLFAHVRNCKESIYEENQDKYDDCGREIRSRVLKTSALMLCPEVSSSCEAVKRTIFPRMEHDFISVTAQSDPLIVKFGERILKNHKDNYQVSYISVRMRDLAKVLIEVMKAAPEISCLEECIDAFHFDKLMFAIRKLSGYNDNTGECSIPSFPPRLGPSLKTCADMMRSDIVKDNDLTSPQKLRKTKRIDDFMQLMRSDWKIEVGSNAEKSRKRNKVAKVDILPESEDIVLVCTKLAENYSNLIEKLTSNPTSRNYEVLAKNVIAHIIILNRRRPGEVVRATIENYKKIYNNESMKSLNNFVLSNKESESARKLMLFHVPGKNVRKVPCLITKMMKKAIDCLLENRGKIGISDTEYLFPAPSFFTRNGITPTFDGTRIINEIKQQYILKNPKDFTATGLRHHCASMSQILGVNDRYVNNLANFMGHDRNIHEANYAIPLQIIQKGQIGHKLLQMTQTTSYTNVSCGYSGNFGVCTEAESSSNVESHAETNIEPEALTNVELETEDDNSITEFTSSKIKSNSMKSKTNVQPETEDYVEPETEDDNSITEFTSSKMKSNSIKKIRRTRWSNEEKGTVYKYFGKDLLQCTNPERMLIKKMLENEDSLKNRTLEQVCSFINNIVTKKVALKKFELQEIKRNLL